MVNASSETHRAISILLVFVLHALLIVALLRFMVSPRSPVFVPEVRLLEMIIPRLPEPRTGREAPRPAPARAAVQPVPRPLAEPLIPAPDIRGFGQALAGCAPENIARLDDAQRSRCRRSGALASYDSGAVDYTDRSDRVPGVRRWERELARKKAPLLLPCGNSRSADPVYTGACILANIANGFTFQKQYENQPGYSDKSGN